MRALHPDCGGLQRPFPESRHPEPKLSKRLWMTDTAHPSGEGGHQSYRVS